MADITDALISMAKDGDIETARDLCRAMAGDIRNGRPLGEHLRDYLAGALEAIANGRDAAEALHTKPKRYQRRNGKRDDLGIAIEVHRMRGNDLPDVKVFESVGMRHTLAWSSVRDIYYRWREAIIEHENTQRDAYEQAWREG